METNKLDTERDREVAAKLRAQGIEVDTVEDILKERDDSVIGRFDAPRLEGCSPLPEPGIYFGMSDDEYHALPALSNTGIKKLAASPMIFWASTPWLSERKRKQVEEAAAEEKAHHIFGKAYHCRLMEGTSVFANRYAVELDPADYPDCLVSTDQIKAAIGKFTETVPVRPRGKTIAELAEQLKGLGGNPDGLKADHIKDAIRSYTETVPVKPVVKVMDPDGPGGEPYERAAVKADWVDQLLELDPEAQVFMRLQQAHARVNAGKTFISADQHAELEIAAAMIERDPELKFAFTGGHAEVVLIWYCPVTGVPMKAKVDYLKIKRIIDLKSIGNQRERSIENAIRFEIATYHYNIQPCVYFEGANVVRQLVREHGASAVHSCEDHATIDASAFEAMHADRVGYALKWASHQQPDEWLWVFQQKGAAPITRGVWFPRGAVKMVTDDIVSRAKRLFREFGTAFGTDPWLDVKPPYQIADEDIPLSATEI